MPSQGLFRRLIIELGHGDASAEALRVAADLARLLGLDLHAVLIEDQALFDLTDLPFAREIRLPTHDWHPFNAARLADEFGHLASQARRQLAGIGALHGGVHALEVLRGDPATCILGLCRTAQLSADGRLVLAGDLADVSH